MPSVHFLGILKEEKLGVMGKCKVAVPNPTGVSECLPITAMEMQLAGCSITTVLHPAYLDTVFNKSYLYRNPSRLAQYIIARIKSPSDDVGALYDFIQSRFGVEKNIERWEQLILHPDEVGVEEISEYNYHHKKIKEKLLVYKMRYPLLRCIPPVEIFYDGISTVKYYLSRIAEKLKR